MSNLELTPLEEFRVIIKKRKKIITFFYILSFIICFLVLKFIERDYETETLFIAKLSSPVSLDKFSKYWSFAPYSLLPLFTQVDFIDNPDFYSKLEKKLSPGVELDASSLRRMIKVKVITSDVVEMKVRAKEPSTAIMLANTTRETFLEEHVRRISEELSQISSLIKEELHPIESEIESIKSLHVLSAEIKDKHKKNSAAEKMIERLDLLHGMQNELLYLLGHIDFWFKYGKNVHLIISPASEASLSHPVNFISLYAFFLAFGFTFLMVYILEVIDTRICTPEDLEKVVPGEFFGTIPSSNKKTFPLSVSRIATQLVMIKAKEDTPKTILITGMINETEKSLFLENLGEKMADLKNRVCILALSQGNDKLCNSGTMFREKNEYELSLVHIDHVKSIKDANWNEIENLLKDLKKSFDFILLKTPPVQESNTDYILAPVVDALLILVEKGGIKKAALKNFIRVIKRCGGRILGSVLSGLD